MKNITEYISLDENLLSLDNYILEASNDNKWIAISVTTKGNFYDEKEKTSQRVVTVDTYNELKNSGHTKGYMTVSHVETLGPVCKTKEQAMEFLDIPERKVKKGKINKGDADYIVWCISSGSMNPSGKTKWDWNFWEEWKDGEIYMGRGGAGIAFLAGAPGSLKVGDKVYCVDNDTQKKLTGTPNKIDAISKCNLEDFRKVFRETYPKWCKSPKRAFGKVSDGLPWTKDMGQIYSIKGVAEEA